MEINALEQIREKEMLIIGNLEDDELPIAFVISRDEGVYLFGKSVKKIQDRMAVVGVGMDFERVVDELARKIHLVQVHLSAKDMDLNLDAVKPTAQMLKTDFYDVITSFTLTYCHLLFVAIKESSEDDQIVEVDFNGRVIKCSGYGAIYHKKHEKKEGDENGSAESNDLEENFRINVSALRGVSQKELGVKINEFKNQGYEVALLNRKKLIKKEFRNIFNIL